MRRGVPLNVRSCTTSIGWGIGAQLRPANRSPFSRAARAAPAHEKGPPRAGRPRRLAVSRAPRLRFELDVDAGGEVEVHQRVHRLRRGLKDVDEALVRAHLEMLSRLLVDVRRAVHAEPVDLRGERDRTAHERARALRRIDDALGRLIEHAVIVRLEADANLLLSHVYLSKNVENRSGWSLETGAL